MKEGKGDWVTPGELITEEPGWMRGHGTYMEGNQLYAAVVGRVEKVNKLISVKPLKARYSGEIGDLVVGRIVEVAQKRWKIDLNARQDGVLMLSSVNLPGGILRRKSEVDELNMRSFLMEGDLVSAEVQSLFSDGTLSIHTRSLKYGKLCNGSLVIVPPGLIKRSKNHYLVLPGGIDVILGLNGFIWVAKSTQREQEHVDYDADIDLLEEARIREESIGVEIREKIARVSNVIRALAHEFLSIYYTSIVDTYEASLKYSVSHILHTDIIKIITEEVRLANHLSLQ